MAFLASRFTAAKPDAAPNGETEPLPQPAIADKLARQFLGINLADLQKYGESMGGLLSELRSALPAIQAQLDEQGVLLAQLASRLDQLRAAAAGSPGAVSSAAASPKATPQ